MASTSSLGASALTSSAEAQAFYTDFNQRLKDIRQQIEASTTEADLALPATALAEARATLTDKTDLLPSYDRQRHEQNLKDSYEQLSKRTSLLVPKRKFVFKRREKVESPAQGEVEGADLVTQAGLNVNGDNRHNASRASAFSPSTRLRRIAGVKAQRITVAAGKTEPLDSATGLELDDAEDCVIDARTFSSAASHDEASSPGFAGASPLSAHVRHLQGCVVLLGHIDGSVFVDECQECTIVVSCKQFRMHKSSSMAIFLATDSIATLEACRKISLGSTTPEQCTEQSATATSDIPPLRVQDFDHISQQTPSPHWRRLSNEQQGLALQLLLQGLVVARAGASARTMVEQVLIASHSQV